MIQVFVDRFMAAEAETMEALKATRPGSYDDLAKRVVEILADRERADSRVAKIQR